MTINEAYRQLKHFEKMGMDISEVSEILRINYDLQFAFDYIEETGKERSEMKAHGKCADYNTKGTGFSLRSMSAYRSGHLKLVFNPFDVRGYKEFFWILHPWKDEFNCIRNAAAGIQKLARRFELQGSILSLREFDSPFSMSRDCSMEIIGVMNDVIEADDFVVGLARYSEINHLTTCYLLNGAENLKMHYELIGGSVARLFMSIGAEFLTSSYGTTEQKNHVLSTFIILAHSSSNLSLTKEELKDLYKLAKTRPSDEEMATKLAESAQFSLEKDSVKGLRNLRTIQQPHEAELTMRLAQSMAPELLENLIEKIIALMNNLYYLKNMVEKIIRPEDAYMELIECYEQSESYSKDLNDFILSPAGMYYRKKVKELKEDEIDEYYFSKFAKYVVTENVLYQPCGELRFISDGKWTRLMDILDNLPVEENNFRMCLVYLSYQLHFFNKHFIEPTFNSTDVFQPKRKFEDATNNDTPNTLPINNYFPNNNAFVRNAVKEVVKEYYQGEAGNLALIETVLHFHDGLLSKRNHHKDFVKILKEWGALPNDLDEALTANAMSAKMSQLKQKQEGTDFKHYNEWSENLDERKKCIDIKNKLSQLLRYVG